MIKPLDDISQTVRLIADVAGTPEAEVRALLRAEVGEIGTYAHNYMKLHGIPFYQNSEKLDALWRDSDAILYEITVWNTCTAKHKMRSFVSSRLERLGIPQGDVFCFGDGLGFDSTWLATRGHRVQYYEPSLRGQQYAQRVFEANGVHVNKLDCLEDIPDQSLDAIVCLDVLEHISEPQDLVRQFHKWLKPGGLLFVHAPFWFIHWARPTHLKENRRLSGDLKRLYHSQGFSEVDAGFFWDPIMLQKASNPSPYPKTFGASLRIRLSQLLLWIGRWDSTPYNAIARIIARAPRTWRKGIRLSAPEVR